MSAFTDQIMSIALADRSPQAKQEAAIIGEVVNEMKARTRQIQADVTKDISAIYMEAAAASAPPAVLNAYERLLQMELS